MALYLVKNISRSKPKEPILQCDVHDYDGSYTIPRRVLKLSGLRFMEKDSYWTSIFWNLYYWFGFFNIFASFCLDIVTVAQIESSASQEDIMMYLRLVPFFTYMPLSLTKTYKMNRDPTIYKNMISELREMFPRGPVTAEEYKIVRIALRQLNFVNKGYYWTSNVGLTLFFLGWYMKGIQWAMGYNVPAILPFEYWLPFDPTQSVSCYMTMLTLQAWQAIVTIWLSMGGDLLICTILNHITLQYDLLAAKITKLKYLPIVRQGDPKHTFGMYNSRYLRNEEMVLKSLSNKKSEERSQTELKAIIQRHHALIRLSGDVEDIFSFPILIHFFGSSIIICFCTFCSALVEKWNEFAYKSFLSIALSESLLLCWHGQKLIDSSFGISKAVFNSGWYTASSKIKRSLLIMTIRAQKPLHITTYGFSVLSLTTYAALMRNAWSYFTLLLNLYKK